MDPISRIRFLNASVPGRLCLTVNGTEPSHVTHWFTPPWSAYEACRHVAEGTDLEDLLNRTAAYVADFNASNMQEAA